MPRLRATKPLRYASRQLVAGDEFEANNRDARVLKAIGKAEDAPPLRRGPGRPRRAGAEPESVTAVPLADPRWLRPEEQVSAPDADAHYRRRDMRAEDE